MNPTLESDDTPIGVVLIATFWILLGVLILLMFSHMASANICLTVTLICAIVPILIGWGLLSLDPLSYKVCLVLSLFGCVLSLFLTSHYFSLLVQVHSMYPEMFYFLFFFISFILILWYLFNNRELFVQDVELIS